MTTHRAAEAPPATPVADAITALREWWAAWSDEIDRAAVIDFRPLINAWHALVAWVNSLADRWAERRNHELAAVAQLTRVALQEWAADAHYQRTIRAWADRRRVLA